MREAFAEMDRNRGDPEAYMEADLDFHLSFAEAAGNPIILSLLIRLWVFCASSAGGSSMWRVDRSADSFITSEFWRPSKGNPEGPTRQCARISIRCSRIRLLGKSHSGFKLNSKAIS